MDWDSLEDFLLHDLTGNLASALLTAAAIAVARNVRSAYHHRRTRQDGEGDSTAPGPTHD
ncbi:hypothetical protein [Streptomyces sp. NEAU-YJ-81]|uniref:hypothetical protein n=1 Tax=Streptomyces sp. NEAU-YJ-81 TaxID=2820288 RepID=UPI001ABC3DBF|nr:hypothetical protein [Streptomyces sp. NEAU-YJ-81]MBO3676121.1 hypothetical protein [Streptomyces sp. NEAU-YJ-81]